MTDPAPKLSCYCPASDYYPGMRGLKVAWRRLPTPLLQAYVCKSDLYLNIIDFRPRIRYRERVSYCVRLISMAFLSAEHDKCIWKIKCCGWVRSSSSVLHGAGQGALSYTLVMSFWQASFTQANNNVTSSESRCLRHIFEIPSQWTTNKPPAPRFTLHNRAQS